MIAVPVARTRFSSRPCARIDRCAMVTVHCGEACGIGDHAHRMRVSDMTLVRPDQVGVRQLRSPLKARWGPTWTLRFADIVDVLEVWEQSEISR